MNKMIYLFLIPSLAHAFTLNNSIGARFKDDKVNVRVATVSGNCNGSGTTSDELVGLIGPAVRDFWNTVPTSRLELKDGGFYDTSDNDFITGELCLSGSACGATPIPAVSEIVITCNTNATNFPGGSSLLALTLPNVIRGKNIVGSVVAINATNSSFGNLSRDRKIAVLAHEIGHAIGLGHSEDSASLMYFTLVPSRTALGQDDFDGVTYLYPVQMDLFGAGCFLGTVAAIKNDHDDNDNSNGVSSSSWLAMLATGLILGLFVGRRKRRPQYFMTNL